MNRNISILLLETDKQQQKHMQVLVNALQDQPTLTLTLTWVRTAAAALAALAETTFTVIFIGLPLQQPIGAGLNLLQQIRWRHPQTPIIALVRLEQSGLGIQAVTLGAYAYFPRQHLTVDLLYQLLTHATTQQETMRQTQPADLLDHIVITSFPAQVAVLDQAGHVISCNAAWEQESARTTDPLLAGVTPGCDLPVLCRQHQLMNILSGLQEVLAGNKAKFSLEYPLREGEKLSWYMICMSPMQWPAGGIVLSRLDITEIIEHQIHTSTYEADLANLKSSVAEMTHELRTPLTSMRLYLDLLERMLPDVAGQKETRYLTVLREQVSVMEQFVNDMLTLMRLEQRSARQNWSIVILNDLVQHVTTTQQHVAAAKGLRLTFAEGALPDIQGNPRQLNQVIINLVANALRYTVTGGVSVTTGYEAATQRVFVRVQDTGIGIAPENLPYIFERFFRSARAQQTVVTGTGLGLAIAQKIVTEHGGNIMVESAINQGSVFTVWLPVKMP